MSQGKLLSVEYISASRDKNTKHGRRRQAFSEIGRDVPGSSKEDYPLAIVCLQPLGVINQAVPESCIYLSDWWRVDALNCFD